MIRISPKFWRRLGGAFLIGACLTLLWLGWSRLLRPWLYPPSPLVLTPSLALESLQAKALYFNTLARPWLLEKRRELLVADDLDEKSGRSKAFAQATQSPKLFRQLDRQFRFDTIFLLGDPSAYQRLLDHLLEPEVEKRDFKLVYLDHWAFVFQRDAKTLWQPGDTEAILQRLRGVRSEDRAGFMAKAATKMLAIREIHTAKQWLDEALSADGSSSDALAGLGQYFVSLGKWKEADSYADRALENNPDFIPALAIKVVAARATDHRNEALQFSTKLNALLPEDPVRLWQHAQVAHEAKQYDIEIAALSRLVALGESEERPVCEYEFHLGEAHAFAAMQDATHAPLAVEFLKKALKDRRLPQDKRKFAEERLALIRERTGLQ
jgi:Tfp pilus assembly protein PilF